MKKSDILPNIIIVIFVALFFAGSVWVAVTLIDTTGKIAAALIGVFGIIFGTFLKYSLEREKEREHQNFLSKQNNYRTLLETIGDYVREGPDSTTAKDKLTLAHLGSWAFGDAGVILATNRFLFEKNHGNLGYLLMEVRKSLGQEELEKTLFDKAIFKTPEDNKYNIGLLFSRATLKPKPIDQEGL